MFFLYMYIDVSLNYKKRTLSMIYLFSESFKILFDTIQLYFFNILWAMTVLCVLHQSCSIVATFVILSHHSPLFTIFPLISFKGKFILRALNLLILNVSEFFKWLQLFKLDTKGCCLILFACTLSLVCAHTGTYTCCCSYSSLSLLQVYHQVKEDNMK